MVRASYEPPASGRSSTALRGVLAGLRGARARFGLAGLAPVAVRKVLEIAEGERSLRARRQEGLEFDRVHGTETSAFVELSTLDVRGPNRDLGVRYEPTSPDLFRTIMDALALDPRGYTFVDYGAGKGRTLLLAAEHGFPCVVGVEFSPELCDAAARNWERFAASRSEGAGAAFELVCVDAGRYEPPSGPAVLFCYNAFGEPVLRAVLDRIEDSLRAESRDVLFVYVNAQWRRLFDRSEAFDRYASAVWRPDWFVVYRSVAGASAGGRSQRWTAFTVLIP
jgi:hypothetical protein